MGRLWLPQTRASYACAHYSWDRRRFHVVFPMFTSPGQRLVPPAFNYLAVIHPVFNEACARHALRSPAAGRTCGRAFVATRRCVRLPSAVWTAESPAAMARACRRLPVIMPELPGGAPASAGRCVCQMGASPASGWEANCIGGLPLAPARARPRVPRVCPRLPSATHTGRMPPGRAVASSVQASARPCGRNCQPSWVLVNSWRLGSRPS